MDWPGVIPAFALMPLLDLGEALVGLRRGRFKEALELLEGLVNQHPDSVFAPEALWWLGAVQQVAKGDEKALGRTRQLILERYPGSAAALRV
jgi:TolA-binding protein